MASIIHPPVELKLKNATDASISWKQFKQSWELYEIASGTKEKTAAVRLATFLHVAGTDAIEKYNGFQWQTEDDKNNIDKVIEKFDLDCQQSTNILTERYKFFKRKQRSDENCDQFVTALRILCSTCEFANANEALRDQFVFKIKDSRARDKLLDQAQVDAKALTFEKCIATVKTMEVSQQHKDEIKCDETLHQIRSKNNNLKTRNKFARRCQKCGGKHEYKACPAFGKRCNNCRGFNHFRKMCRNEQGNRKEKTYCLNKSSASEDNNENNDSSDDSSVTTELI